MRSRSSVLNEARPRCRTARHIVVDLIPSLAGARFGCGSPSGRRCTLIRDADVVTPDDEDFGLSGIWNPPLVRGLSSRRTAMGHCRRRPACPPPAPSPLALPTPHGRVSGASVGPGLRGNSSAARAAPPCHQRERARHPTSGSTIDRYPPMQRCRGIVGTACFALPGAGSILPQAGVRVTAERRTVDRDGPRRPRARRMPPPWPRGPARQGVGEDHWLPAAVALCRRGD